MKKTILTFLTGIIVVLFSSSICSAEVNENFAAQELQNAVDHQQEGYSVSYGNYYSYSEAEKAGKEIIHKMDNGKTFPQTLIYVSNRIVSNGTIYSVCSTVEKYRNINDIDWKTLAASFKIDNLTGIEKAVWIHQWLCDHLRYDLGKGRSLSECLESGLAKCDEYSIIYANLLNQLGVETVCADGFESGSSVGHMWNLVKLDGKWYYCDVSMDDETGSMDYFMKGYADDAFLCDHKQYMNGKYPNYIFTDCSRYNVSKSNYFSLMESTEDNKINLYDYAGISKKYAKNVKIKSVTVGCSGKYTKKERPYTPMEKPGSYLDHQKNPEKSIEYSSKSIKNNIV